MDTQSVWWYMEIARKYNLSNLDSSLKYNSFALDLANELKFNRGTAAAVMRKANALKLHGKAEESLKLLNSFLPLAESNSTGEYGAKVLQSISHHYMDMGIFDSTFHYLNRAEIMNKSRGFDYNNCLVYLDHSFNYAGQSNDFKQEEYLKKAYSISKPKAIRKDHGMVLYFLMSYYFNRNQMKEYAIYANEYLDLTMANEKGLAQDMNHQMLYFFDDLESVQSKISKMNKAIAEQEKLGHWRNLAVSYEVLSELLEQQKKWPEALAVNKKGLKLCEAQNLQYERISFLNLIARNHEKLNDFKKAYLYSNISHDLEDSMNFVKSQLNMQELEVKYETEKKDQDLEISHLSLAKKSSENKMLLIGIGALLLLSIIIARFLFIKSRFNKTLSEKNQLISKSLEEKEMLLREIHHRVKNNLQVVSSLLKLQARGIADQQAKAAIRAGQDRVKSMALIHQNLYQNDNFTGMDIKDYIGKLSESLFLSYNINPEQVSLTTSLESVILDVETLIPIGLILNELLSNALKHAFPEHQSGQIDISFTKEKDALLLQIKDNGIGFAKESLDGKTDSFGMTLVRDFAQKLKADLEMNTNHGTHVSLRIQNFKLAS